MIVFPCTRCGKSVRVKDDVAGRKVKCPHCAALALVPAADDTEDDARVHVQENRPPQKREDSARQADSGDDEDAEDRPRRKRKKKSRGHDAAEGKKSITWILGITLVLVGLGAAVLAGIWWLDTRALLADNEKTLDKMRGQVEKEEAAVEKRGKLGSTAALDKLKTHLDAETKKQEANWRNVRLQAGFGGGGLVALLLGLFLMMLYYGRGKGGKKRNRAADDDD